MSAFFVANVRVRDPQKFHQYAQAAGHSMQPFGGEVLIKGLAERRLAGNLDYPNVALVRFPDQERLNAWYESEAYQALIPLREEAADMLITSYQAAA